MNTNCPLPQSQFDQIVIGHGGGGRLTHELLRHVIAHELGECLPLHDLDAGFFNLPNFTPGAFGPEDLVFTTDSFVVDPIFFPGGDIGKLSIVGTVNDIAMMGARPVALSLSFILEEGFSISEFRRVLKSIANELGDLNLKVTCGDTKVVPRGKGDRIFINTSAVGVRSAKQAWQPRRIEVGDVALISRDIGSHGVAVMCARNQLGISADIKSDCHELLTMTTALIDQNINVKCARDLTRGGLLSAAVEIAATSQKIIELNDAVIPRKLEVQSVCELLGLDVYSMANEGACILFVPAEEAERALSIIRTFEHGARATLIGQVVGPTAEVEAASGGVAVSGKCLLRMVSGVTRRWNLPPGELLPRIC
jgi:hydrogenase expression/formation protein HypE